ncbi:MAG: glycosyltransferase family 39 protein [Bacteroidetes bacterium]|nr:glycosyltransferase family 39 protein [Bacteroidota bacterium]
MKNFILKYFSDIRFWIVFFFLIRLYGITDPPLEIGHNWRQVTGIMVSKNFLEVDNNILYPRVDETGEKSGIIGMEMPIMNYMIYMISYVFGFNDWYGRLLNLIVSSIGTFYFFRLVKVFSSPQIAFNATITLLVSIWFAYSRKTMPDTFSMAIVITSFYYGLRFFQTNSKIDFCIYGLLLLVGTLSKIPSAFLLCNLAFPLLTKGIRTTKLFLVLAVTAVVLSITCAWYFYWNPHLSETYGNWYNSGKGITEGVTQVASNLGGAMEKFYFSGLESYVCFAVFIFGIVALIRERKKIALTMLGINFLFFIGFIFKSGDTFCTHSYYIIPFVPVMAVVAGYALDKIARINKKYQVTLLLIISLEALANQNNDFRLKEDQLYKMQLESFANSISYKNELIAINGGENPQLIYFAHRNGWSVENEKLCDEKFLDEIKSKGCKAVIIDKHKFPGFMEKAPFEKILETDDFVAYRL